MALSPQTTLSYPLARRYLALYLPLWPTDCLKRADRDLAATGAPLVLWEKQQGALRLVAADARAGALGIGAGQSLADARARYPHLLTREIDRPVTARRFADFADWHTNLSPLVAALADVAPWGDLVIDITGASHLFGGEGKMRDFAVGRLAGLGFAVTGVIAPTIGAAWALAHFSASMSICDTPGPALAELPVAALRLAPDEIAQLNHLGLKRIGQLYGRDRKGLMARFGSKLLLRLDQALGRVEERFAPRLPPIGCSAERRFADPIGLIEDILLTARDLAYRLAHQLEAEGLGAASFHLFLYRVDHQLMTLTIRAARPTRDPRHIAELFVQRAERLGGAYDAGFGIEMIRLAAGATAPLPPEQAHAFTPGGTQSLEHLLDRVTNRLGPQAVLRQKFVDSHIPERAVALEPFAAAAPDEPAGPDVTHPRPLRLLPRPEPIAVSAAALPDGPPPAMVWRRVRYRFTKTSGPERIAAEWWTLPEALPASTGVVDDVALTRDYFIAEDEAGRRFWLFREGFYTAAGAPQWYMHGIFA